jgi:hypothetical protein
MCTQPGARTDSYAAIFAGYHHTNGKNDVISQHQSMIIVVMPRIQYTTLADDNIVSQMDFSGVTQHYAVGKHDAFSTATKHPRPEQFSQEYAERTGDLSQPGTELKIDKKTN